MHSFYHWPPHLRVNLPSGLVLPTENVCISHSMTLSLILSLKYLLKIMKVLIMQFSASCHISTLFSHTLTYVPPLMFDFFRYDVSLCISTTMTVAQLVKRLPAFYGTQSFITVFTPSQISLVHIRTSYFS
jgi:hypothetical protein